MSFWRDINQKRIHCKNKTVDLILDKVVGAKYWDTFFGTKWDLTPIVEGQFSLVIKI